MGDKDSKTEEPTAHKISEARKDGNVFQSQDVCIVVMLLGEFVMLRLWLPVIYRQARAFLLWDLSAIAAGRNEVLGEPLFFRYITVALICVLPLLLTALVLGILSHGIQTGFNRTTKPLRPKFDRLNPINGMKRVFSLKKIIETLKNILKIIVLCACVYIVIKDDIVPISRMKDIPPMNAMIFLMSMIWDLVVKICIAFSVIAFLDYLYEKKEYHDNLKMTKQEVKEEYKMMEGNPEVKNKMKARHREMSNRRMMQDVPQADVIVRNPTHFAVALKYDPQKHGAPYVVAKGTDFLALRIVEIAEENRVPWIEDRSLARGLYAVCEIGQEIPFEYYSAVAELLVFIYRQEGREDIPV